MRGIITLLLVLSLKAPNRELFINTTFVIVFFTNIVIGISTKPIVEALEVGAEESKVYVEDPSNTLPPEYIPRSRIEERSKFAQWWFYFDNEHLKKIFGGRVRKVSDDDQSTIGITDPLQAKKAGKRSRTRSRGRRQRSPSSSSYSSYSSSSSPSPSPSGSHIRKGRNAMDGGAPDVAGSSTASKQPAGEGEKAADDREGGEERAFERVSLERRSMDTVTIDMDDIRRRQLEREKEEKRKRDEEALFSHGPSSKGDDDLKDDSDAEESKKDRETSSSRHRHHHHHHHHKHHHKRDRDDDDGDEGNDEGDSVPGGKKSLSIERYGKDDDFRYQRDGGDEDGALLVGDDEVEMDDARQARSARSIDLSDMRNASGRSSYGTIGISGSGKRGFYDMFQGDGTGGDGRKEEIRPTAERILKMGAGDDE